MKKFGNLGLMIEIMGMLIFFIVLIQILTGVFARSEAESIKAKRLSKAVILASNSAEVFMSSDSLEQMFEILNQSDNARLNEKLEITYDEQLKPDADGKMLVEIIPQEEEDFIHVQISILYDGELIYELQTGHRKGENQ